MHCILVIIYSISNNLLVLTQLNIPVPTRSSSDLSIAIAVVSSRLFGLPDPRSYGSGNPGATNVLRTGKKAAALVTLLGDAADRKSTRLKSRHLVIMYVFLLLKYKMII